MKSNVFIIGEILWDCIGNAKTAAGAPLNFARHLMTCGLLPNLVSAVGNDAEGDELVARIHAFGVPAEIKRSNAQTGFARVTSTADGKNTFELAQPAAWDELCYHDLNELERFDAIYFGTLSQRANTSRRTIQTLVEAAKSAQVLRILDINLRPPFVDDEIVSWSLAHCDLLKFSSDERAYLVQRTQSNDETLHCALRTHFGIQTIVETMGEKGARAWDHDLREIFVPAPKVDVLSTVGAGDAFLAAFCAKLHNAASLREALNTAVNYAANVISRAES